MFFPLSLWAPYFIFLFFYFVGWPATIEDGLLSRLCVCLSQHIQTPTHTPKAPAEDVMMAEMMAELAEQKSSGYLFLLGSVAEDDSRLRLFSRQLSPFTETN